MHCEEVLKWSGFSHRPSCNNVDYLLFWGSKNGEDKCDGIHFLFRRDALDCTSDLNRNTLKIAFQTRNHKLIHIQLVFDFRSFKPCFLEIFNPQSDQTGVKTSAGLITIVQKDDFYVNIFIARRS